MKNKVFISVLASMMLSGTMLNAKDISLQEAVENIVKKYNVTYISKANNLKDKSINSQKVSFGGGYGIK
ncbi:hypothetical protein [Aliarcobacter vitoriensis]|uniref:Uncharacterized protein n=1 Tax=Aliarcobacter vitoriensis TaxID=2011099 RepID=A0A366MTZ1_9BACT|nr:hypothetical protein [Aliarcobacter vitoriensis]RBQ29054.1 hypothetical protein CRU91_05580 [Aliarcobacter vitoriensis]